MIFTLFLIIFDFCNFYFISPICSMDPVQMLLDLRNCQSKSNPDKNFQNDIYYPSIEESVMNRSRSPKPSENSNEKSNKKSNKRKTSEKSKSQNYKSPQKKKKTEESDLELLPLIDPASPIDPFEENKQEQPKSKKSVFLMKIKFELGNQEKAEKAKQ